MSDQPMHLTLVRRLRLRAFLDEADVAAIGAVPMQRRSYPRHAYVVREGIALGSECMFIETGVAFRQKLTTEGARQIVSLQVPGDFLDLQHLFLKRADHNVQALTQLDTIEMDRTKLQTLIAERPTIGRALWIDALVDASILREWMLNVGRRDARARLAHLLCEYSVRMKVIGASEGDAYILPMSQEEIGDAVGLTPVHVNRTLRALSEEGLISRDVRHIAFADWRRMKEAADFHPSYLHLDEADSPIE